MSMSSSFYIRRGNKTVGPISIEKIKANLAAKKIISTDLIASSLDGPWTTVKDFPLKASVTSQARSPRDPQVSPKPGSASEIKTASNDVPVFFGRIGYIVSMVSLSIIYALIVAVGQGASSALVVGQVIYFLVGTGLCVMRLMHIGWNPLLSAIFLAPGIFLLFPAYVIVTKIYDILGIYISQIQQMQHAYALVVIIWVSKYILGTLCQVLPKDYAKTKKLDLGGKIGTGFFCVLYLVLIAGMLTKFIDWRVAIW